MSRRWIDTETGCRIWLGAKSAAGYGQKRVNGKLFYVHRLAYEERHGLIPEGMEVCHSCDTPACFAEGHLFLGTHRENMQDAYLKGRFARGDHHGSHTTPHRRPRGERNGAAKINTDVALAIRVDPRPNRTIAQDYGISYGNVGRIKRGEVWAHVE